MKLSRDQALADLQGQPSGSYRTWAERWGWSLASVQRFLATLERRGVCEFTKSAAGTGVSVYRPEKWTTDTLNPSTSATTAGVSGVSGPHLDTGLLDISRCATDRYTGHLIAVMNRELASFPTYRPVRSDNRGSHRAGDRLETAGVPLEFAAGELARCCRVFNPSKHGQGELPRSLALFERGILTAWRRASQLELGVRTLTLTRKPERSSTKPQPQPISAVLGAWQDEFLQARSGRS